MSRVFLPQPLAAGSEIALPEEAFRHLVQVLRMREGEPFIAFNGEGGEYRATLTQLAKRSASARIEAFDAVDRESPRPLHLAQCVSKGDRMDYTLQKAVELGVTAIQPLLSSRSVVRMDGERWEKKLDHWHGVIVSACEQSGRTRIPQLHPVQALTAWLDAGGGAGERLTLDRARPARDAGAAGRHHAAGRPGRRTQRRRTRCRPPCRLCRRAPRPARAAHRDRRRRRAGRDPGPVGRLALSRGRGRQAVLRLNRGSAPRSQISR